MTDGKLHLLTCVAVPLAERVEGCFGLAGPVGGAGPTGAGGDRLAQVVRADFLGVVGGCFTPVCNTAGRSINRCSDLEPEQTQRFRNGII